MSTYYDEYRNSYYNPDDVEEQPGDNQNWKMIQKGFDAVEEKIDPLYPIANFIFYNSSASELAAGATGTLEIALSQSVITKLTGSGMRTFTYFVSVPDSSLILESVSINYTVDNVDSSGVNVISQAALSHNPRVVLRYKNISENAISIAVRGIIGALYFYE